MKVHVLATAALAAPCLASRLYAASYSATVASLEFSPSYRASALKTVAETHDCGPNPSWLMLDSENHFLYCLDEGLNAPNGTLTSFNTNSNGTLAAIHHLPTVEGPVHSNIYFAGGQRGAFFAVAHYTGAAVTTYSLDTSTGVFNRAQTFKFTMAAPGPVPSRQDAPHPHSVVVDPTGQFILVPDLGADLVRIFHVNQQTGLLEQQAPLKVAPGSGPRHGVFWTRTGAAPESTQCAKFFLVSELDNALSAYDVMYPEDGTISLKQTYRESTYGNMAAGNGSSAAEVAITSDNNRILVSNRGDKTFGPGNDSMAVFSYMDGRVAFSGLYPAYGSFPRQFDINENNAVAIALQKSHAVAVTQWDDKSDTLGPLLAKKDLVGQITAVVWDI